MTLWAVLVFAAPAQAEPTVYAPEGCEFQMTFPEAPYTSRRCRPNDPSQCDVITSYTKVFGVSHTMNFYVSCKPTERDVFNDYDREILRTTLIGMAGKSNLETFETSFDDDENVRRGSLLGAGESHNGKNTLLYMGQIWVGHGSVMTVEGELIGDQTDDTDKQFADIMRTLTTKKPTPESPEDDESDEEAAKENASKEAEKTEEKPEEKKPLTP